MVAKMTGIWGLVDWGDHILTKSARGTSLCLSVGSPGKSHAIVKYMDLEGRDYSKRSCCATLSVLGPTLAN